MTGRVIGETDPVNVPVPTASARHSALVDDLHFAIGTATNKGGFNIDDTPQASGVPEEASVVHTVPPSEPTGTLTIMSAGSVRAVRDDNGNITNYVPAWDADGRRTQD